MIASPASSPGVTSYATYPNAQDPAWVALPSLSGMPNMTRNDRAPDTLVSLKGVGRTYLGSGKEPIIALEGVDLEIHKGEIVALVGSSGCGKSTLLRIIAGLDRDFTGELSWKTPPQAGRDIGFVFQEPVLLPWRTVKGNAQFGLEVQKVKREDADERVEHLLGLAGLTGFEKAYPRELSGGMRQRLAIVRALAYDPMILLMDEPFGSLDHITRERLQDDLLAIWTETPKTIIFVTHSVDEATYLADRVVVMTPRPGLVREIHNVPLPRPRNEHSKLRPEFAEFQALLRRQL